VPGEVEGRYLLVVGHRRLRAVKKLGWTEIDVTVAEQMSDARRLSVMLTENDQRSPLSSIERAEAYKRMMEEFGLNQTQVARLVGKHPSTVNQSLQLLKPIDERTAELDAYRARRDQGVAQRGRPLAEATMPDVLATIRNIAGGRGGELTQAQASLALRIIEQGAYALQRERARDRRVMGTASGA